VISSRVAETSERVERAEFEGDYILAPTTRGKWRVYEDGSGYSQTSGQTIKLGKLVRRFDAEADYDGSIAQFDTADLARAYAQKLTREAKESRERARKPKEKCTQCGRRVPASREGTGFCTGRCADLWRNPNTRVAQ
jgi:hypothetical protein